MQEATGEGVWPGSEFFEAKLREQQQRHLRFNDTAYNLEPNIKEGPGGLRDVQLVLWIARRYAGIADLEGLRERGFLTAAEFDTLSSGRRFLWRIRHALHARVGRREDRLLFDHQRALAREFGYEDTGQDLAVECFMQDYYRTVIEIERLCELLVQILREVIVPVPEEGRVQPVNRRFRIVDGFLDVTYARVFEYHPFALLEAFLILAEHAEITGVRARTIRLIREYRERIDDDFRGDLRVRSLFMEILRQPRGLITALRRMNRYGVLAAYLPVFGRIVGRMQHDLFHAYTVDQHTLFVLRNLRRFAVPEHAHELPVPSALFLELPKPELLYIAGLFHDIAKGRGGDHSELGAADAEEFCQRHGLAAYDAHLVAWLVRHHLLMSVTAQRKDIGDPDVIREFAMKVRDMTHLNYLYLLTVADIRATNPSLWNDWKNALLLELYEATARVLRRGLENPIDATDLVGERKNEARALLLRHHVAAPDIERVFGQLPDEYFRRHPPGEISWHVEALIRREHPDAPLVLARASDKRGGTEIFIATPDRPDLFAITTATLDELALNIVDARILRTPDDRSLSSYLVLDLDGQPITDAGELAGIAQAIDDVLCGRVVPPPPQRRHSPRRVRQFAVEPEVNLLPDPVHGRSVLELIATDTPGLLARVARVFAECGVRLHNAKIMTLGSRAEDVFFVSDLAGSPLTDPAQIERLSAGLRTGLRIEAA